MIRFKAAFNMSLEILILLVLTAGAVVLFAFETFPAEVTALGLMLCLIVSGILTPQEAFSGFASDTVMMILGLLILSASLLQTGVVDFAGQLILKFTERHETYTIIIITSSVALLSCFMSNTAATAFFLPVVMGFAQRKGESPSKFLMPVAFASILTSSVTLISTSTNIVVSELLSRYGQPPLEMFELTPIGLPIAVAGLIYLNTVGAHLMPKHGEKATDEEFGLKPYLSELVLLENSTMIGKEISESEIVKKLGLNIIRVVRDNKYYTPRGSLTLKGGDVLLVEGAKEKILAIKDIKGIEIKGEARLRLEGADPQSDDYPLVEAIIPARSRLIGRTLKQIGFRDKYGLIVLAINRSGTAINQKMSMTPLRVGDLILLQGDREEIQILNDYGMITVIGSVVRRKLNRRKAPIAVLTFLGALTLATVNIIPFPVATLLGAFIVLATGCLSPQEAYREVDWKVIILISCILSLGLAMERTGAGMYLSERILFAVGSGTIALTSAFFIFSVVLTQIMSNQAAAVVLIPIAIPTAAALGIDPRPLVVTVTVAASVSYLTPLEPSCLMVYGPGGYRFRDFFIVGFPLTVLIFIMTVLLVPLVWPY